MRVRTAQEHGMRNVIQDKSKGGHFRVPCQRTDHDLVTFLRQVRQAFEALPPPESHLSSIDINDPQWYEWLMNITLKQLTAFCAVAERGSFSRAAEQLHSPQSAVSVLVRGLEQELAARLFDRTTRRVELTAAGREFLGHAQKTLSDLQHAIDDTHALGERRRGRLTVAGPPLLIEMLIPKVLAPFKRDFPGVKVVIIDARTERIIESVKQGEADIGIGTFVHEGEEGLVQTRLAQHELMLFCPANHVLARRDQVLWRELKDVPMVGLAHESGVQHLVDFGLRSAGISSAPEYEVAFMTTALALVEVGVGVTALPSNTLALIRGRDIAGRPLVQPTVMREISMITRHGRSLSPAAAEWRRRLQQAMSAGFVRPERSAARQSRNSTPRRTRPSTAGKT
jgi:DNA-binding transcriptional LysR family regulator